LPFFSHFVLRFTHGKLIPLSEKEPANRLSEKRYQFPVRNTKWLKNGKLRRAILSAFYNISQRNFGILLILWCSFKLWWNFCLDLSRSIFCSLGNRYIALSWTQRCVKYWQGEYIKYWLIKKFKKIFDFVKRTICCSWALAEFKAASSILKLHVKENNLAKMIKLQISYNQFGRKWFNSPQNNEFYFDFVLSNIKIINAACFYMNLSLNSV
jgi:hypothetical protein